MTNTHPLDQISRIHLSRSRYTKQFHFCNRHAIKTNSDFYINMISNNSDNPRHLWNSINRTLHRKASVSLRAHDSTTSLCKSFSRHFKDKITPNCVFSQVLLPVAILIFQLYITFAQCLNQPHILKLLKWFYHPPNKSYELDSIPVFLLASCFHTLIGLITQIINWSLISGVYPSHFKHAL